MKNSIPVACLRSVLTLFAAVLAFQAGPARAADGTWNTTASGQLWGTAGNWAGNIIADGTNSTAYFNALDLVADTTVHLDTSRTNGSLVFGDTDPGSAAGWILANNSAAANVLTLSGGTPTITVNALAAGKSATIQVVLAGSAGLTKAGVGNLTLSGLSTYTGQTTINAGTLALAAGNNTLLVNKPLQVNGGATLDFGAYNQYVGSLSSTNTAENGGGTTTGSGTLTVNQTTATTFAGSLSNALNLVKTGNQTLTLASAQQSSGKSSVMAGGLTLKDGGMLTTTNPIPVNYATLTLDNTGAKGLTDRVGDTTAFILNGGGVAFSGRASTSSTETLGPVSLNRGTSYFTVTMGTSGSAALTLTSLSRTFGTTLDFIGSTLGASGNNPRLALGGDAVPGGLVNNIMPGAAVSSAAQENNPDFACYIPYTGSAGGIGRLGAAGYPGYDNGGAIPATDQPTYNIKITALKTLAGSVTINAINLQSTANQLIAFPSDATVLNLVSGTILKGNWSANTIGAITEGQRGVLTSGGSAPGTASALYLLNHGGTWVTVYSKIDNNGASGSTTALVVGGPGGYYLYPQVDNTYSGGTWINGQVHTASAAAGVIVFPMSANPTNGLVINNVTVTASKAGQIHPGNIATLNGGAGLTLAGTNTLAGLIFNSNGGTANPTVNCGTLLTLTGDIVSTPENVAVTPIISGGTLNLNGTATHDITVSALTQGNSYRNGANWSPNNGLQISSVITNGGFTKKGAGVLYLSSGSSTYAGQLTVEEGVLNVGSTFNASSANGPLGRSSDPVLLGGAGKTGLIEYTGGNATSTRLFTMATGGVGGFQVDTATTTLTLAALLNGSGGLLKTGPGILALSNLGNTYSGMTTLTAGTLKLTAGSGNNNIAASAGILVGDSVLANSAVLDVTGVTGGFQVNKNDNSQTLGGHGTVTGDLTILSGGHLAPGGANSIGALTLSKTGLTLNFQQSAVLDCEIGGSEAAPANDMVRLTGTGSTIAFGAAATLNLSMAAGATVKDPTGLTFVLFQYTGTDPVLPAWTINYGNTKWKGGSVRIDGKRVILSGVRATLRGPKIMLR